MFGYQSCRTVNDRDNDYKLYHLLNHTLMDRSAIIKDAINNEGVEIGDAYYSFDSSKVYFL